MLIYILKRLALIVPSLASVATVAFLLIHLIPGDPVDAILGEQAAAEDRRNLRAELGLDKPVTLQFAHYLAGLVHGNLGRSLHTRDSVADELTAHFPATAELALAAMFLAVIWAIPAGVMAAVHSGRWPDRAVSLLALIGMSVPGIFLGPLLIYFFAIALGWFPVSDRGGLAHLFLPALSLALPLGAVLARMTRAAMLEVLNNDYMRTARAKGVSSRTLYFKHALGNALIPVVTILGLQLSAVLTGTVVTETIFDWPGIGLLTYGSIQRRDYPMVQGCVLFVATLYLFMTLLTDLVYGAVDPRARIS